VASVTGVGAGFEVVRATSVAALADHLADRLRASPPSDPFASIEVAVPSRGMERWLAQRLSGVLGATGSESGVCANVDFPFLGGTIQRIVAGVLGEEPGGHDPWTPDRLAWPLLAELDALPDDPVLAPLRAHLSEAGRPALRRRLPLARRIADLFDRYALYRPDMVAAWRNGAAVDGDGEPLPPNLAWQPVLWRRLHERLAAPSPDLRLGRAIELLRARGVLPGTTPASVTVFGVLAVPPRHLELLAALGTRTPVTLYAVAPCPAWDPDEPRPDPRNPLLVASGARARDAHTVLAPYLAARGVLDVDGDDPAVAAQVARAGGHRSVLSVLQADVRADRRRGGAEGSAAIALDAEDRSVQVHTCHGLVRQLEVLREVLLGLLEDDPGLEPRDIVVLTPDVAAVAPLLPAAFPARTRGAGGQASGPETLPIRIADRTLGHDSAVAQALLAVLELVTSRAGASEVLDLLAAAPVRARFGLTSADLDLLPTWLRGSGISWGRDAAHRAELLGLEDDAHTWRAGLDRWTLGAAMADDAERLVGGVRPFDEVEGAGVELLGRILAATDTLFTWLERLREARPIGAWHEALAAVLDDLLDPGPGPGRDAALTEDLAAVRGALQLVVETATGPDGAVSPVALTLEELRGLLSEHLGAVSGAPATGTGAITVTGFVPLRNLPHRVVCLVGMDDGAWPRAGATVGFDLLEVPRRPGDPDTRLEDRQQLLDAVLAARDHLVVTVTGHEPRTNEARQPAVPISELLDVLADTVGDPGALVTAHPLQPHSARYFREPRPGEAPIPRAFDPDHLAAARAARGASGRAPAFLTGPLPAPPADLLDLDAIELEDVIRFLEHPVRFLLQRRLGLRLGGDDPRLEDRDPTELGGLERWAIGQDLLEHRLAGRPVDRWRSVTLATGTTPVGGLGSVALDGIETLVEALVTQVAEEAAGESRSVPVDVTVPVASDLAGVGRARVVGSVPLRGATLLHVGIGQVRPKARLAAWIRLLALAAGDPHASPIAVLLGRHPVDHQAAATPISLDPTEAGTDPATALGGVVELYLRGHRELLPVLPDSAEAYVAALARSSDHDAAIAIAHGRAWQPFGGRGDGRDPYVVQALGPDTDLAEIAVTHPFAAEAIRLWEPVLAGTVRR
jgi:exodeoxyribonuclease V gamma subunit